MSRSIEEPLSSRPAYFWWFLANALAACFAMVSWAVCLNVFGRPEIPRNYEILGKLKRQPVLKRYTLLDLPNGNALGPKDLYMKYFAFSDAQQIQANSLLLRNYLTNFERPLLLTYVEGDYRVSKVRALGEKDFFSPGVVVEAQAMVTPDDFTKAQPYPVVIEFLFSTEQAAAESAFRVGDLFSVKKSPNCAVVVHVSKSVDDTGDSVLRLTVIPIVSGPFQSGDSGSLQIMPPVELRPSAGLPVLKTLK